MKILITKALSNALLNQSSEKVHSFLESLDKLKSLNKTEIRELDTVVKLSKNSSSELYAYKISTESYALFSFSSKKELVIIDIIKLVDNKEIEFLVAEINKDAVES